jgi:hypothetical protein
MILTEPVSESTDQLRSTPDRMLAGGDGGLVAVKR